MYGKIINGKSVGCYQLGWTIQKLKEKISGDFTEESLAHHYTITTTKNIKFWIAKEKNIVTQIMVFGSYNGKFEDSIGIGSTISDLRQIGMNYSKEDYIYTLPDYPGICFEL
ncbi:hypothetical protein GCM10008014_36800 [Paenibacillus silvae]|uniref:Uncharacterized protein n=1 Tax=Paenibacillus silvae TaxID=1325358 RepID=A0ABQ1ZED1_9BACL|nr:hypothetical protein [Paenibacillus silvae]GGH61400.1 hypothetical protein GCM10008014_36800 [Paenibacillus silvae]